MHPSILLIRTYNPFNTSMIYQFISERWLYRVMLMFSGSLSMPVLEFTIWWVYLISIFFYLISEISYLTSERISKQVWKSCSYSFQEHLLCHWDSNKGRIIFFFLLYFCNYVLINLCFRYKCSLLFLCSSFHWSVFVVFHLFESHTLFSWR